MLMKKLKGTFVVMVTPFTDNEDLDEKGLRQNIAWYIKEGIHGVICNGSTSEFANLSKEERKEVIDIVVDEVKGRVPVMSGTAAHSTRETIEMTAYAHEAGCDAVLLVPPYYGGPNQEEIFEYYREVAEAVPTQIMVYNNPFTSGVDIQPKTIARIAEIENVPYVKESSSDIRRIHEIVGLCGKKIDVWCGWEDLAYESLILGCKGWVCPTSNIIPRMTVQLFDLVQAEKLREAEKLYYRMLPLLMYLEAGQLGAKVKAGMNLIGQCGGKPRKPFLPLSKKEKPALQNILKELGVL
jgi:4-hydroxy-tetrahydrodipicolinate synthase